MVDSATSAHHECSSLIGYATHYLFMADVNKMAAASLRRFATASQEDSDEILTTQTNFT